MTDEYRYCVTYNVYGSRNVEFSDSLYDLHRSHRYAEDCGDEAVSGFWEIDSDTWKQLDVSALDDAYRRQEDEQYMEYRRRRQEKPWRLWVFGPDDSSACLSRHATRPEAEAAAARLPAAIRTVIKDSDGRP